MVSHPRYMQGALLLSRRNLGQTWPNPAVGCIIINEGKIVGTGATGRGGRPHAEAEALAMAGDKAKGATMYVTLEPCAHHGKTPPCADAIVAAGVARVIVAHRDPHPQVNGKGIEILKNSGIDVIEDIGADMAAQINRGFFSVVEKKRPYVALKIATSQDEKIASPSQRWITSEDARDYGHLLRSEHDAIATGIGTVLTDDPLLTCRLPKLYDRSPVRIVFDSRLTLPPHSQLAQTAKEIPVWALTTSSANAPADVRTVRTPADSTGEIDIAAALETLAKEGLTRLLVEGGQKLTTAFLASGMVDRIYWFKAPMFIGDSGLSAVTSSAPPLSTQLARWQSVEHILLGQDTLDVFECLPAS